MPPGLIVLLVLAYGFFRSKMPESLWPQAPDLQGYLIGALLPPVLDLVAMGAIALYAAANFQLNKWLVRGFVVAAMASGVLAFLIAEAPVLQDLSRMEFRQGVVTKKLGDQRVELGDVRGPEHATSSLRLPHADEYERVPTGIPVEFRVAPNLGVGYVVGVLE